MSKKIVRSFVNSIGQTVRIPDLLTNGAFLYVAQRAAQHKTDLDLVTENVDVTFASGRKLKPRIGGVLPALTEISLMVLLENEKNTCRNFPVIVTMYDMITMFNEIGVSSLINEKAFRQAWSCLMSKNRDAFSRQISLPIYMALGHLRIREVRLNRPEGHRGATPIGYYVQ